MEKITNITNVCFNELETLVITKIKDMRTYHMLAIYTSGAEIEIPKGRFTGRLDEMWQFTKRCITMNMAVEALQSAGGDELVRFKIPEKEMTLGEIEAKLGHKVKIISK